jgi:hypothetical protein
VFIEQGPSIEVGSRAARFPIEAAGTRLDCTKRIEHASIEGRLSGEPLRPHHAFDVLNRDGFGIDLSHHVLPKVRGGGRWFAAIASQTK